jgi:hypothetical protein
VGATQGAQCRKEQKRPPTACFNHWQGSLDHGIGIARAIRVGGQAPGYIEQRLACELERARPAPRLGIGEAELAGEMAERLAHRERRRGKDPGARAAVHLLAEELGR